jgi:hypothetical protein
MNEEYPDQGPEGESQYSSSERTAVSLPRTGDDRVDDAVAGLSRLPERPADEQVTVLEEVHGRLRDILGELSEGRGETARGGDPGPRERMGQGRP